MFVRAGVCIRRLTAGGTVEVKLDQTRRSHRPSACGGSRLRAGPGAVAEPGLLLPSPLFSQPLPTGLGSAAAGGCQPGTQHRPHQHRPALHRKAVPAALLSLGGYCGSARQHHTWAHKRSTHQHRHGTRPRPQQPGPHSRRQHSSWQQSREDVTSASLRLPVDRATHTGQTGGKQGNRSACAPHPRVARAGVACFPSDKGRGEVGAVGSITNGAAGGVGCAAGAFGRCLLLPDGSCPVSPEWAGVLQEPCSPLASSQASGGRARRAAKILWGGAHPFTNNIPSLASLLSSAPQRWDAGIGLVHTGRMSLV